MLKERQVRCTIRPSIFKDEYVVSLTTRSGEKKRQVEFVSDSSSVAVPNYIPIDNPVEGMVRLWISEDVGSSFEAIIPASGGSDSMKVRIDKEFVVS